MATVDVSIDSSETEIHFPLYGRLVYVLARTMEDGVELHGYRYRVVMNPLPNLTISWTWDHLIGRT